MRRLLVVALTLFAIACTSTGSKAKGALAVYSEVRQLCIDVDLEMAERINRLSEQTMIAVIAEGYSGQEGYDEWDRRMSPYFEVGEVNSFIRGAFIEVETVYQTALQEGKVGFDFLVLLRPLSSHYQMLLSIMDEIPGFQPVPKVNEIIEKLRPFVPERATYAFED